MRKETAHNRLSLAHHRLVGRALRVDRGLVDEAEAVVDAWFRSHARPPPFVETWQAVLRAPAERIARTIGRRTAAARQLRGSSPFALIPSRVLTRRQAHRFWNACAFHATRILGPADGADYAAHLRALDPQDRIRRFGRPVGDAWIGRFVAALAGDAAVVVIGHYDAGLVLDGAVQVGLADRAGGRLAEVGLSVLPAARRRGLGYHLLERALLWPRNHGASRFYTLFAVNNEVMVRLARHHHMAVSYADDGIEGVVVIHPLSTGSVSEEVLEEQIGAWDYHAKAHRSAFPFVAGRGADPEVQTDLRRLVKLAQAGRTDVIAAYVIAFRYVLVRSGYSAEDHTVWLAALRRRLEPLAADDIPLSVYISGLPEAAGPARRRYGVWRLALAH